MGFEEILGHERAVALMRSFLSGERTPHAVLLEGPEGVGKSLVAREFARGLLCRAEVARRPCGECSACRRALSGSHPGLTYIDTPDDARLIRIESVHELLREAHLRPLEGDSKVLLIPRAERMNPAAANALLKTLEEPPPGTYLVLTAVRTTLLPTTILSRCARVRMGRLPLETVERILTERVGVSADDARALAAYSGGSPGRAAEAAGARVRDYRRFAADRLAALPGADDDRIREAASEALDLAYSAAEDHEDLTRTESRRVELLRLIEVASLYLRDVHVLASCGGGAALFNRDLAVEIEGAAARLGPAGSGRALSALERSRTDIASNCRPEAAMLVACGELSGCHRASA